jgi:hypothetical protein
LENGASCLIRDIAPALLPQRPAMRPLLRRRHRSFLSILALGLVPVVLTGCGPSDDASSEPSNSSEAASGDPQEAFLGNLSAACGHAFEGRLELTPDGDAMLTGNETLLVHFRDCLETEVRVPFHVEVEGAEDWNRSRTWYVMQVEDGLELRHDHREPDGSESRRTWYGGYTLESGTPTRQDFRSPERTEAAGVPVGWRIEIEPGVAYRYGTTRDGAYDWMIAFDLSRPISGPIPDAWGHTSPPSRIPGPP